MRAMAYRIRETKEGDWLWELVGEDGSVIETGRANDSVEARVAALNRALELNQEESIARNRYT